MIFKDRTDAAEQLAQLLLTNSYFKRKSTRKRLVVVSLLRGGIPVGSIMAQRLGSKHYPLVVTKIPAPYNPELAIGALCFETIYLEKRVTESLGLTKLEISDQINIAREKFNSYLRRFKINRDGFVRKLSGAVVVLVDDGIATGATVKTALLYLKQKKPRKIILAVPVAPIDFDTRGFDMVFILYKDRSFSSVSQFYKQFPQVEDGDVLKILNSKF